MEQVLLVPAKRMKGNWINQSCFLHYCSEHLLVLRWPEEGKQRQNCSTASPERSVSETWCPRSNRAEQVSKILIPVPGSLASTEDKNLVVSLKNKNQTWLLSDMCQQAKWPRSSISAVIPFSVVKGTTVQGQTLSQPKWTTCGAPCSGELLSPPPSLLKLLCKTTSGFSRYNNKEPSQAKHLKKAF